MTYVLRLNTPIKADLCNTKTVLAEVKITNSSLTSDVESLKYKVLAFERYSRSYNIRIGGIMEAHGENCMDHVVNILTKLGYSEDLCRNQIEIAHRTGRKIPRHIILKPLVGLSKTKSFAWQNGISLY